MKPFVIFVIDRHTGLTEALSLFVLLWRVLQVASLFLNVRPQAEVEATQIWRLRRPNLFGSKAHVGI